MQINQPSVATYACLHNKQAIVDFLGSLTASRYDRTVPSGRPVGGNIR